MKPKARQKNKALLLGFCVGQAIEIKLLVLNASVQLWTDSVREED